jgi:hypothetical protein
MNLINKNKLDITIIDNKTLLIMSYQYNNLDPLVSKYQYEVFKKFNIELNQFQGNLKHSEFMDKIINEYDYDFYIFFDIDCIPLKKGIIEYIIEKIGTTSMIGIEQQSNSPYILSHIYAGPACFGISKQFYNELGRPSFNGTKRSDVGEELTYICEEKCKKFYVFKKTYSENNLWKLGLKDYFGHGTIYEEDLLYHQFEILKNQYKFLDKCKEVLK